MENLLFGKQKWKRGSQKTGYCSYLRRKNGVKPGGSGGGSEPSVFSLDAERWRLKPVCVSRK